MIIFFIALPEKKKQLFIVKWAAHYFPFNLFFFQGIFKFSLSISGSLVLASDIFLRDEFFERIGYFYLQRSLFFYQDDIRDDFVP